MKPRFALLACLAALLVGILSLVRAAEPAADKPVVKPDAKADPKDKKPARTPEQIGADLQATFQEFQKAVGSHTALFDEKKRAEIAPKAIGPAKKALALFNEFAEAQPLFKDQLAGNIRQFQSILALLGDAETIASLEKAAASKEPSAIGAKSVLALVAWWKSTGNEAEQSKVVDEVARLVKDNDKSEELSQAVMAMAEMGAASPALRDRIEKIATNDLKTESAKAMAEQLKSAAKLRSLEGKPIDIAGEKLGGGKFSSKEYKGKVILVDFWATWCGPCMAELPRVKKAYADFHGKGFEIVGVSCDRSEDKLKQFVEATPEAGWVQLFDAKKPGWHPLATEYGINGIPTMFLIDKKGVVRTVSARENFEELIPKMLEEKAE